MLEKLKFAVRRYHVLVENFTYLSALQIFNIAVPLFIFPYLIRILGPTTYGQVIFAQTIVTYFSILISFGFNLTATKEISIHRNDKAKLSEIVSSVLQIKAILWLISLIIVTLLTFLIPDLAFNRLLLLFSFSICFNEFLFPHWYFQGIEKMKYITFINLGARLLFLSLIFIFVRDESDFLKVPLLNGTGAFLGGISGLWIVFGREGISFKAQPVKKLIFYFRDSLPIFASNLVIAIKDKFSVIFIGIFLGMDKVAVFDLGIKIMTLFIQPIILINDTIYPKVAKDQSMDFLKKIIKYTFILVACGVLILQPFLSWGVRIIGGENLEGVSLVTRILLLSPVILSISMALSRNCIIVFGKYGYLLWGMVLTTAFYLLLIFLGWKLSILNSVLIFSIITVAVFFFELLYRIIIVRKLKLM